jgi:hypothetical protein
MTRAIRPLLLAAALSLPQAATAVPPGTPASIAALAHCDAIDELADAERDAALVRGLAMAEAAVAADAHDARAHFALFCHLGKRMERAGISLRQITDLRRLKRELDLTLTLAPGDPDALIAKGALLLKLPRLLGGDSDEAETLLRQALVVEPDNDTARCYLDAARAAQGGGTASRDGC